MQKPVIGEIWVVAIPIIYYDEIRLNILKID